MQETKPLKDLGNWSPDFSTGHTGGSGDGVGVGVGVGEGDGVGEGEGEGHV